MDITKLSLTTTQAAKVLQIDLPTLRFWDKENALPIPPRAPGQWRKFDFSELVKVAIVEQMVRRGLPVAFATDRLAECLDSILFERLLLENEALAVASFQGARNLVAVKFVAGPLPSSLFLPEYWAQVPAHSVEIDGSGVQRSTFYGRVSTLPVNQPESVCMFSLPAAVERVVKSLEKFYAEEEG